MLLEEIKDLNGFAVFQIYYEEDLENKFDFLVKEVCSWDGETNEPAETEDYLRGYIKWDGCSHIWLGNKREQKHSYYRYLHLCGKESWEEHSKLMDFMEICKRKYINLVKGS